MHFWPAFNDISRTTSVTDRSNSGLPGATSGPRIAAFSESASALNGIALCARFGWVRSRAAVCVEPVKVTTSCVSSRSSRPPTPPTMSCSAPGGSSPDASKRRTSASVR